MARRSPPRIPSQPWTATASIPCDGRAFVYVAACSGPEDILKVGLSHDPVARWSAFHRRWFEEFDLEASVLIEAETRRDAQALETALHRRLLDHNCPAPLTMREQFGGVTEWYRGAWSAALEFAREAEGQGHVLHAPAADWIAAAMRARVDVLAGLLDQAKLDLASGLLSSAQRDALRDLVDAHRAFDPELDARLADDLAVLQEPLSWKPC
jgi:hypothetical protein